MRNQSLLIIFFFCLLFQNAYSIIPMTKRNELPMIKINGNKKNVNINKQTYKIGNDRYFLFDLKDLFEASNGNYEDFLFFTINSTELILNIKYTTVDLKMPLIRPIYAKNTFKYFSPNITITQSSNKGVSNIIAVYAKKSDKNKKALIIRVNDISSKDNITITPLANPPNVLITQLNNIISNLKKTKIQRDSPKFVLKKAGEEVLKSIEQKKHDIEIKQTSQTS